MITVANLMKWAAKNAIGRSFTYPEGWIDGNDLIKLGKDILFDSPLPYNPDRKQRHRDSLGVGCPVETETITMENDKYPEYMTQWLGKAMYDPKEDK